MIEAFDQSSQTFLGSSVSGAHPGKKIHMFSRKLYNVSPVTDGHDEPPVLGGVLLISHLLHQSVKLCLGVPEDPHFEGSYGFSDAHTPLRGFS